MTKFLEALAKQPYWIVALVLGTVLVALPTIDKGKDGWTTHPPTTWLPATVGLALLLLSAAAFTYQLLAQRETNPEDAGAGLDLRRVKESDGALWTTVNGCEIRVENGRIEDYARASDVAIVLPCNEYFDDLCVSDSRSALGAYVTRVFDGRTAAFISLMDHECRKKLGPGIEQQKTDVQRAASFGAGRCVLLTRPLDHSVPIALVSTTTQRGGQGLSARISYLFDGMRELAARLADERINKVVMPILGGGHGGIDKPLALVGLLLAVAEVARYGQGSQRLKRVTIVVFRRDANSDPDVDQTVARRALALIGSRD
jgi:hypothetical protein